MRSLRAIRSESIDISVLPDAVAASLSALPFSPMLALAWFYTPGSGYGRALVTLTLGGAIIALCSLAVSRRRRFRLTPASELRWVSGVDGDDPYRAALRTGASEALVLEHNDPALLLTEARRIVSSSGIRAVFPQELEPLLAPRDGAPIPVTLRSEARIAGPMFVAQSRAAHAAVGAALFVSIVFLISARAESGLSPLSLALPLISIALVAFIGTALASLELNVTLGPSGLRAERCVLGVRQTLCEIPADSILAVHAVGHPGYPARHALFELREGLLALRVAGDAAHRLAAHVQTSDDPDASARLRTRRPEAFEVSRATP